MKQQWLPTLLLCLCLALMAGCKAQPTPPPTQEENGSSQSSGAPESSAPSEEPPAEGASPAEGVFPNPSTPGTPPPSLGEPSAQPEKPPLESAATPLAKQSWPRAYETFYSGGGRSFDPSAIPAIAGLSLREGTLYPIYETAGERRQDLLHFARQLRVEDYSLKALTGLLTYCDAEYGCLLNGPDGESFYGEGILRQEDGVWKIVQATAFPMGSYDYRTSLTMTAAMEEQLLALGFAPATTTAKAVRLLGYNYGVLFEDGERAAIFQGSQTMATTERMEMGRVYTLQEICEDILTNIDAIYPDGEVQKNPDTGAPEEPSPDHVNPDTGKPVIYLYPEATTDVRVEVGYPEAFTYTYPAYNGGWQVTAHPDGRLVNRSDGSEHYYLFWEGNAQLDWDFSKGFVVPGADTEAFLREKLIHLGLTPREYNDFITYWAPEMSRNPYNLITFAGEQYQALAPLTVSPAPDSVLRVHMVYRACGADTAVEPQTLPTFTREGFTVVEWGGTRAR